MVCQLKKYIEKLKETYIRLFNTEPSKGQKTPLEKNYHPELEIQSLFDYGRSTSMAHNLGEI